MSEPKHIDSPVEGIAALQDYFLENGLGAVPEDTRAQFKEFIGPGQSPVQVAAGIAELVYARRDDLPPEILEIGAQLALLCQVHNLFGLGVDNRGAMIAGTIRSMNAVATEAPPAVIVPPEPLPVYVAEPTPPEVMPFPLVEAEEEQPNK